MTLPDLLESRYSCRAFRADPVPDDVIEELFGLAQRTASWCNTQPWQVHLTSGEATARFAAGLTEHVTTSAQTSDLPMPESYSGVHDERRRETGYALYRSLGIARDDHAARGEQMLKNFSFFGAPHVAVITSDRAQGTYGAIDCGGYVATLLLAAQSLGLGACPQAAIAMYSGFVREWLDLPEDRIVVCAVSFGHPDDQHPVNGFRTSRADLSGVLHRIDS